MFRIEFRLLFLMKFSAWAQLQLKKPLLWSIWYMQPMREPMEPLCFDWRIILVKGNTRFFKKYLQLSLGLFSMCACLSIWIFTATSVGYAYLSVPNLYIIQDVPKLMLQTSGYCYFDQRNINIKVHHNNLCPDNNLILLSEPFALKFMVSNLELYNR